MESVRNYLLRLFHVSPAKWPGKIVRFALRQLKEMSEEGLVRLGLINQTTKGMCLVRTETLCKQQMSYSLRDTFGKHFFICSDQRDSILATVRSVNPETEQLVIAEVDRICNHVFDLLGSGPTQFGKKIDWHTDFKTGHHWNPKTYYKRIRPAPYPGGYDIKVPWELSRCQHFGWLGQAYWFTNDEMYAREFVVQMKDWIASNPWPWGVNWACTMDVAIRAVNWLWGYAFFQESPSLSDEFRLAFFKSLLIHGRHIFRNLENRGGITSNHYLSNLVGLLYLGIICPIFKEAKLWREFSLRELEQEMINQVYPDGVDFEASTSYHRLVLEMFLSATLLAQRNGHSFSKAYMQRLEKMVEFIMYITVPDGTIPLMGDNDNGRLHRLKVWEPPEREWVDFRYLLAIGAVLFQREDFAKTAGDQWEEAIWFFGGKTLQFKKDSENRYQERENPSSMSFPTGGIYIMRSDNLYMIIDAGGNGQKGIGGHAHNDTFSVELFANGISWIVDPGTYVYTTDYEARNLFRSTCYHNTIEVDDLETCRFKKDMLFRMLDDIDITVHTWESNVDFDLLDASHQGYNRLTPPIIHRRQFYFDKAEKIWLVQDVLSGKGKRKILWHYHLAPHISVRSRGEGTILCEHGEKGLAIVSLCEMPMEIVIVKGWVSPSYGVRVESPIVRLSINNSLPLKVCTAFVALDKSNQGTQSRIDRASYRFYEYLKYSY